MNVNYGYTAVSGGASVVETDPIAVHPYTTQAKTANFTAAAGNVYLVDTTGGTVTATLPAANVAGQTLAVKLVAGTNPVTVVRAGSDTIGAAATTANITLDNEVWEFTSSGSGQWNLTAGNKTLASLDGRFTQRASNLSDLGSAATSRTNLGLGGAATLAVGTTAGTVAAGDDSRITGAAQKAANLSDLASAGTARTNLGLGGAALLAVGTTAGTVAAGDDSRVTGAAQKASNLSDLASASTSRTNLGLAGAAVLAVGTTAGTVAAGNDGRLNQYTFGPVDHGLITWSFDPAMITVNSPLPTAGRLEIIRVHVPLSTSATNVIIGLIAGGSSLTSGQCFAALYTAAGALVGVSADQATAWASVGLKTMPLTGGPFPLTAGDHYVALWFNGSTGPALGRLGNASATFMNIGLSAPNLRIASANTGLTTTAPPNIGSQTATGITWWTAIS